MKRLPLFVSVGSAICISVSIFLLSANVFGLVFGGIDRQRLPAWPGPIDNRTLAAPLDRAPGEDPDRYLDRLARSVHHRMAVYWQLHDQAVPLKENWVLHAMQYVRPAYRDYQYYDSKRALRRGVGQCGQFALVAFDVLRRQGIKTNLWLLPGHTVITAELSGRQVVVDPEFGVVIRHSAAAISARPELVRKPYASLDPADTPLKYKPGTSLVNFDFLPPEAREDQNPEPFSRSDIGAFMTDVFADPPIGLFGDPAELSKQTVFEPTSYVLKWVIPPVLFVLGVFGSRWARRA